MALYFLLPLLASTATSYFTKPTAKPEEFITAEDYPRAALLEEREGVVVYEAELKADGTVSYCRITQSSGVASLDQATCDIIMRRAKFDRVTILDGKPKPPFAYEGKVVWKLPGEFFRPADTTLEFDVADGQIANCRGQDNIPVLGSPERCRDLLRETDGKLRRRDHAVHVKIRQIVEVTPAK